MFALRSIHPLLSAGIIASFAGSGHPAFAATPDRIVLKNGRHLEGQIVRRSADTITLRGTNGDATIEREDVRRIDDASAAYFAAANQPLPPWDAIVDDLRANEQVRRLTLISSGRETRGEAAGWPCLCFQINDSTEIRIYGDPKNPAGIRLGLRGGKATDRREQNELRSFLAGFLNERSQIAALYALKTSGGVRDAANLRLAFGSQRGDRNAPNWWLFAWNLEARKTPGAKANRTLNWEGGFERDRDGHLHALLPLPKVAWGN